MLLSEHASDILMLFFAVDICGSSALNNQE
jgi:hypothetical protein